MGERRVSAALRWLGRSLALSVPLVAARVAAADFFLKGGETLVFLGDSITQDGRYVEYIEAYLSTRFPEKDFKVVYAGLSSETISGTSEPDHAPPRPCAHDRFARDVLPHDPDVVVACYGMNDGNYHPFEPERFAKYQAGVRRLEERVKKETRARLVLVTPPPFDPYRRVAGDPNATHYGYKFPAVDYDETLRRYSEWLLTRRGEGVTVADVHSALSDHLRRRREGKASFFLSGDAVHPGATGHWLMAQAILEAWSAPPALPEAPLEARREGDAYRVLLTAPLPLPMDPEWDRESIALSGAGEGLSRHRLAVKGLPAGRYELRAEGKAIAEATAAELEKGVDLLQSPGFPTCQRSREVLELIRSKRRDKTRAAEISLRIKNLARPQRLELSLVPVRVGGIAASIGVNIHFTGAPARDLDRIRDAGFGWVRMDFAWEAIEREKGAYRFEEYDALLDGLAARGLRALFILDYSNRLYEEAQSVRTEAGRQAFARFAAASASRYRGRGVRWEVWNEPNLEQFWKPQPSPDDYAALVIEAAKAIRAADPEAAILAPASSGFPWGFVTRLLEKGILEHIDEVSVHPYRNTRPETVRDDYARLRDLLSRHVPAGRKPPAIVSGEWGYSAWHYGGIPLGEELQGAYLARELLTNLSEGIPLSIWYDWANDGTNPRETEQNFGTVTAERTPKPAYLSAKTLTSVLSNAAFARRLAGAPGDNFLLFAGGQREKLAAWTEDAPHAVALEASGWSGPAPVIGSTGAASRLEAREGLLELRLDGTPQYLDLPGGTGAPAVHGLSVELFAERLRVRAHRGGPGKRAGTLTVEIGSGDLRTKVGAKLLLEDGKAEATEFPVSWPLDAPSRLGVVLRDEEDRRLLAAFPTRACAAVKAFQALQPAGGEVKSFSVSLDGDAKVPGEAVLVAGRSLELGQRGERTLGLEYRFGRGWKFARVAPAPGLEAIPGKPSALSLWVKGDGLGQTLRSRFKDSKGEVFQSTAGAVGWKGWRQVTMPLDGSEAKSWGGNEDGRVDPPIAWDSIFLLDSTREGGEGAIEIASPLLVYPAE